MLNNDVGMNMPVVPAYNNGNNAFGGDGWWILLLFLFAGGGMWGGMGGYGGGMGLYPWMNQADITTSGFQNQMLNTQVMGVQNAITSGFGDVQTALCGGFAGVNATVNNAQNALAQQMYTNQIAELERSFAAQTANTQGMNALQAQFAQCCCNNQMATQDVKYTIATEACANRSASKDNTQMILDKLCQMEINAKDDTISQLRSELLYARGQASQNDQTAAIQAGQRALANEVEQYVAPSPRPAYIVQNPNCCTYNAACGCGVA